MSCGPGSSCCDELLPAKKELRAGQLSESGLCILQHNSGSEQLKKWGKLNGPSNGDQEHGGNGNVEMKSKRKWIYGERAQPRSHPLKNG
jgi:hypothetical protein